MVYEGKTQEYIKTQIQFYREQQDARGSSKKPVPIPSKAPVVPKHNFTRMQHEIVERSQVLVDELENITFTETLKESTRTYLTKLKHNIEVIEARINE